MKDYIVIEDEVDKQSREALARQELLSKTAVERPRYKRTYVSTEETRERDRDRMRLQRARKHSRRTLAQVQEQMAAILESRSSPPSQKDPEKALASES